MRKQNRKKKIAFVLTTFVVGGVEKSFLDLLKCIDTEKYDITVFLPDERGEWTSMLKEQCRVRYLPIENYKSVIGSQLKRLLFFGAARSLFFRVLARLNYKNNYRKSTEYFIRSMPRIRERFDCAVAYQIINDECVLSTLYRINAPKKVVWSHAFIHKEEHIYGDWYNKFDRIFCVSDYAKNALTVNFPFLSCKTEVFYNALDSAHIIDFSNEPAPEITDDTLILVTVGRLSREKGQLLIPKTARLLVNAGYSFKWYLIGDGDLRDEIEAEIQKEHQENNVILLGSRSNPYPYMKACDIYVQTSLVEGWGLTVTEAKILHKPIVTTDAGVMSEQIRTGVNGIIVPDNTPETLASAIGGLIDAPGMRESFVRHLQQEDVCHQGEIEKLYAVFEQ